MLANKLNIKNRVKLTFTRIIKFAFTFSNPMFFNTFIHYGVAASIEHRGVIRKLPIDFVVDVGANRGQFSLLIRNFFPNAQIFCFEPLSGPYQVLTKIFEGSKNVHCYKLALGEKIFTTAINVSAKDDSSSLLPISKLQTSVFSGTEKRGEEFVQVKRLDEVLDRGNISKNSLIKIDVQGYEYEVLLGCSTLISDFRYVYCECSNMELYAGQKMGWEIQELLLSYGFTKIGEYNIYYGQDGRQIQSDILFERLNINFPNVAN